MPKLSVSEVQTLLKAAKSDALSAAESSKLSERRGKAMDYYQGDMAADMPAAADRSHAVSTDVADVVEGLMPSMMEVFVGGDRVAEFAPVGREDEKAAQQETDYINHVFMEKNNGFIILYTFVKDALLSKNAITKVFWEEKEEYIEEMFWGLPEAAYGMISQNKDIEIIEHTERVGIPGQQPMEEGAY